MRKSWRFPLFFAVTALAYVAVVDWLVIPFNEEGHWQRVTGWLDGAARLLQLPGMVLAVRLKLHVTHHTVPRVWAIMMIANLPFYCLAAVILRWMWRAGRGDHGHKARGEPHIDLPQTVSVPVPDAEMQIADASSRSPMTFDRSSDAGHQRAAPTRRQFIVAGNRLAFGGAAALLGYGFFAEPQHFIVTRHTVPIRGLPASLDGLTIAQLTDIHHGPWTPLSYVRRVVAATNALGADLIALTGDYVLYSPAYVKPVIAALAELRARIGVVAVLGNHDWWEDALTTISEFRRVGIPLLDNSRLLLTPDRKLSADIRPSQGLCVAGVGDLWEGRPSLPAALRGVNGHVPRLLLSHNPDVAELHDVRTRNYRVDLMLCGHTHGGQVWVPGLGRPMIPSAYGQKYARGLVRGPACPVFVSCGLGTTNLPIRFCTPPEIAVITLHAA